MITVLSRHRHALCSLIDPFCIMQPEQQSHRTDASIIFATRDRCAQLRQTLDAYQDLDTDGISWELIVVDNCSQDETPDVLRGAAATLPLTPLLETAPGKSRALNKALPKLRGELIVFTDDDALPDPNCLRALLDAAQRWPDEAIFGGRIDPFFPQDTPAWISNPAFRFSVPAYARYAPAAQEGPVRLAPFGPCCAVRRSALGDKRFSDHLGPQPGVYAMGCETDLLKRVAGSEYQYIYVPGARVRHVVRPDQITLEWLLARAHKLGRGQAYMPGNKKMRGVRYRGVPLTMLTALLRTWLRYNLFHLIGMRRRYIDHLIKFEQRYATVRELYRRPLPQDESQQSR